MLGASVLPKFAMTAMVAEGAVALRLARLPRSAPSARWRRCSRCSSSGPAPRPSAAVLMTGLLGGTVGGPPPAGSPLFSHTLFGLYLGALMWAGLWLREPRLRALLPLAR